MWLTTTNLNHLPTTIILHPQRILPSLRLSIQPQTLHYLTRLRKSSGLPPLLPPRLPNPRERGKRWTNPQRRPLQRQRPKRNAAGKENTAAHAPEHGQATTKDLAADSACIDATGGNADIAAGHVNYDFIDMTGWDKGVGGANSMSMYLERSASSSALVIMVSKWWLRLLFSPKTSYRCIIILFNDYHGESQRRLLSTIEMIWCAVGVQFGYHRSVRNRLMGFRSQRTNERTKN